MVTSNSKLKSVISVLVVVCLIGLFDDTVVLLSGLDRVLFPTKDKMMDGRNVSCNISIDENDVLVSSDVMDRTVFHSKARFVIVVGLEGTGHHIFAALVKNSTATMQMKRLKIFPLDVHNLMKSLHHENSGGLFNPHCGAKKTVSQHDDMNKYMANTVALLRQIEEKVQMADNMNTSSSASSAAPSVVTVPINGWETTNSGMMSYPNFEGPCRFFNRPNLDLLYEACYQAKVDCAHVYTYRDPYSILKSTNVNRKFNPTILRSIQLYISMLSTIFAQFQMYPSKLDGCLGFFEANNATTTLHWKNRIRDLLYQSQRSNDIQNSEIYDDDDDDDDDDDFERRIQDVVRVKNTTWTQAEKDKLVSPTFESAMRTFVQLNERMVELCYDQYNQNQPNRIRNDF